MDEYSTSYSKSQGRQPRPRVSLGDASGSDKHVFPSSHPDWPQNYLAKASPNQHNMKLEDEPPENIIAPIPRRHLLDHSASQHWLHTPPLSPSSSRGVSPTSSYFGSIKAQQQQPRRRPRASSSMSSGTQLNSSITISPRRQHTVSIASLLNDTHATKLSDTASMEGIQGKPWSAYPTKENSAGRRWIRWMHKRGMRNLVVPSAIGAASLVKWCIGLGSYSGQGTPPMFGDYEAQRHWMELTLHLPVSQWYTHDLQYWGLDYPPLTAYISWLCGKIGSWINPSWFTLDKSRGIETPTSKVFMRSSVFILDALVYVPALLMFAGIWQGTRSRRTQNLVILTLLFQPALLLIDFGHFQYNSVMLGLTLFAINFFARGHDLLGAFIFVLSLGFKQMALYYAPAIGSYLFAKCLYLGHKQGFRLFVNLALTTVLTFLLVFLPFLPPFAPLSAIIHPISRIFPFSRGLFEDKVANFWCASNVVVKWKEWAPRGTLVKLSVALTAIGFLPCVFVLLRTALKLRNLVDKAPIEKQKTEERTPILPLLPYALLTSSMSFFLFSFQVHEKTVLLPLMPITLLLSASPVESAMFSWGVLVNNVAVFSMWPLLKKDGLATQYLVTLILWNRLVGYNPLRLPSKSFIKFLSLAIYIAGLTLHFAEMVIPPPSRYPDLFPVLNVLVTTPVFGLTWLWSIKCGVEVGWALCGLR